MSTPSTIPSGPFAVGDDRTRHPARRHRSTGVPSSPLHGHGGAGAADLDRPTVTRLAEAAALTPSGDPLLDDAVIIVAEGLDGLDGPARLHRARNIVQGLMLVFTALEQRGAGGKLARDASATTTVMRAFREEGVEATTAAHFATLAVGALAVGGHLR